MKKSTFGALFLTLLLGTFGLGYGVSQASTGLARTQEDSASVGLVEQPATPSGVPTTGATGTPTAAPRPAARSKPAKPQLRPGPRILGRGDTGARVRDLQARLKQIGWYSPAVDGSYGPATVASVKGFQAKRKIPATGVVDARTQSRLRAMTRVPTHNELHNIAVSTASTHTRLDPRCKTGRALCIDKRSRTLRWVVDGKVRSTYAVRFGASYSPTREGLFHVGYKSANHVSKLYGSAMPFSMFFSGGQAVHYSSDFAARGYYGASHGCVNVRDYNGIRWLFGQVRVGDKVVVYWA